ncbi:hypothetical protein [Methylobacterium sp. WL116]|uniref:hypothetical protein n=1 Tax=Methylobacterium sp. WL116 TaxID=2603889 RepID=UPI0011CC4796|nr:hypothetical protein [Methylobacterium sp. WL116]TXM92614.1 hypothetical protein FV223_11225 [Methylobacterium sp. WL116]
MSDEFDPNDFDAPRRDLASFLSELNKVIRNNERGYQAGLRGTSASLLAAHNFVAGDFGAFEEMIDHKCFADDEKVHSRNESNYHEYVAKCIVKRCFAGSNAFPCTLSKFTTVLKHLAAEGVEPEECAQTIKDAGGFKDFYELAVAAKREGKAASGSGENTSASKARSRSGDKSTSERCSEGASVQGHAEDPHGSQLWIDLNDDVLTDFSIHAEDDEIRLLKVRCDGKRGRKSPMIWTLLDYEILDESNSDDDDI